MVLIWCRGHPLNSVQIPPKAESGRSSLRANQTTSFFLVSGFGSGAYSAKLLNGTRQRFSGFSQPRPCEEDVLRMFVTGGPPVRGAVAFPIASSQALCRYWCCGSPGRIIGEDPRHRGEVANVAIDHAEQPDDRFLIGVDRIKIAHSMTVPLVAGIPELLPRRDVCAPEANQMPAPVRITARLGTRPATHPLFKLPDWRLSRAPQRREIDSTVRVAASAFDFEVSEAGVQGVANRRGGLCGPSAAFHTVVPGVAGRDIGSEPRLPGALFRMPDPLTPLLEGPPMRSSLRSAG